MKFKLKANNINKKYRVFMNGVRQSPLLDSYSQAVRWASMYIEGGIDNYSITIEECDED